MDKDLFLHILDDSSSEDEFVFEESEDEELLENLVLSVKGLHLNVHIWSHCGKFTGTIQ
ncbi:uncharacterized protein isoform X2 [Musca autumnalis]|uniref:uncharacterized protein isoform X2 n=1 Tax=Musca autumnalis TaxID=221902 RepID=UPI003CF20B62